MPRLDGLPMGVRLLLGLAASIIAAAGPEALAATSVVLNVREDQLPIIRQALLDRKMCGFTAERFIITVQPLSYGYRWDSEAARFMRDPKSGLGGLGSGYALMQLAYVQEGWTMAGGALTRLNGTVLEALAAKCAAGAWVHALSTPAATSSEWMHAWAVSTHHQRLHLILNCSMWA